MRKWFSRFTFVASIGSYSNLQCHKRLPTTVAATVTTLLLRVSHYLMVDKSATFARIGTVSFRRSLKTTSMQNQIFATLSSNSPREKGNSLTRTCRVFRNIARRVATWARPTSPGAIPNALAFFLFIYYFIFSIISTLSFLLLFYYNFFTLIILFSSFFTVSFLP